jgi:hypothetical protein
MECTSNVVRSSLILLTLMMEAIHSSEHRFPQKPHGTSQKMTFFITTAGKTSNLTITYVIGLAFPICPVLYVRITQIVAHFHWSVAVSAATCTSFWQNVRLDCLRHDLSEARLNPGDRQEVKLMMDWRGLWRKVILTWSRCNPGIC